MNAVQSTARLGFAIVLTVMLPGCLAKTALDVATAPVKVVSKGVDMATTSQSEADEKRGRELRKQDEQRARAEREQRRREAEQQSAY